MATIALAGTMAILLAWTWFAHHLSGALVWWSVAYGLAAVGTLFVFRDHASGIPFGYVLDEMLHILSAVALWFGFRAFNRQRVPWVTVLVVCVAYIAVLEILVDGTGYSRRSFIDLALIIVIGLTVLSVSEVVGGRRGSAGWRILACAILAIHSAALAFRIILDIKGPITGPFDQDFLLSAALVIEPAILPVVLGYALLALAFERRNADTEDIAERDALTGLLNRRGVTTWLDTGRHASPLSVIVFDLDHFKAVNDTYGHAAGDGVLQEVAERVTEQIRAGDAFARIGGEEFLVLVPGTGQQGALALAERMREALASEPLNVGDTPVNITGSFGVYVTQTFGGAQADDAIAAADEALYTAKRSGRNRVVLAKSS